MKKIVKYLAILILVLLIALVSIPFMFKGKLIELTKEQINNNVNATVNFGEFDLSIFSSFPNLTFSLNDLSVVGKTPFEGDTLAYIQKFSFELDLMSVFGEQIKVRSIEVTKPVVNALINKEGFANWDIAMPDSSTEDTTIEDTSSTDFHLALKRFAIVDAAILYDDQEGNMSAKIAGLNFDLQGDMSLSEVVLKITTTIKSLTYKMDGINYLTKANIGFDGEIDADMEHWVYTFKDNNFRLNAINTAFAGKIAMPDETISMDLSVAIDKSKFKDLLSLVPAFYMNDYNDLIAKGDFSLKASVKGDYNDSLMPAYEVALLVNNGYVKYPDLPKSIEHIAVDLKVKNESSQMNGVVVNLKKFYMEMAGNPFEIRLITNNVMVDPHIDAAMKGRIDLASVKEIVPLDSMQLSGVLTADLSMNGNMSALDEERYTDFNADGTIGLEGMTYADGELPKTEIKNMVFKFSPQAVRLDAFDAKLGKSDLQANGEIDNLLQYYFKDSLLKGTFTVTSNYFDANEWMTDEETTETTAVVDTAEEEPLEIVEVPKNIDFVLNTALKKVHYDTYDIDNISGAFVVRNGEVKMEKVAMNIFDGHMTMDGTYSTADMTKPSFNFDFGLQDLDIPKTYQAFNTIQEMAPVLERATGLVSGHLKLASLLNQDFTPQLNTLDGLGAIDLSHFVLDGTDAMKKIDAFFKVDKFSKLAMNEVNANFTIEDGNISFEPMDMKAGNAAIRFEGKQSVDGTMDYVMKWKVPREEFGSQADAIMGMVAKKMSVGGITVEPPKTVEFNVNIGGKVDKPKVTVTLGNTATDMASSVKEQVKEKITETVDKAKEEAIKKAQAEADRLLKQAQQQADRIKQEAHRTAEKIRQGGRQAAKQIRAEADKQAKDLVNKATNPFSKKAAQVTADKLKKEADKKAKQTEAEANRKADTVEQKAKKQADNIVKQAKAKGDALIEKAKRV